MVAAVSTIGQADARPGGAGKASEQSRCDSGACAFQGGCGTPRIGLGLIPYSFESGNPVLERWIVQIGDPGFDGVIEALEP
ncbi:MAG: hypothetical protein WCA78_12825 [Rhizomicrobium sp.]